MEVRSLAFMNGWLSPAAGTRVINGPCFWRRRKMCALGRGCWYFSCTQWQLPFTWIRAVIYGVEWAAIFHHGFWSTGGAVFCSRPLSCLLGACSLWLFAGPAVQRRRGPWAHWSHHHLGAAAWPGVSALIERLRGGRVSRWKEPFS